MIIQGLIKPGIPNKMAILRDGQIVDTMELKDFDTLLVILMEHYKKDGKPIVVTIQPNGEDTTK